MLEWKKDGWKAAICLAPMLLLMALFTFYPIINTIITSFKVYPDAPSGINDFVGWGFGAYFDPAYNPSMEAWEWGKEIPVLQDKSFWSAVAFTVLLAVISVPLSIIIALLISVALCSIKPLRSIFQTIFFLPYVTNGIAFGMVFASIFSGNGLINTMFNLTINWIGDGGRASFGQQAGTLPDLTVAMWAGAIVIITYTVWNGLAFKILVFVGGIQGIDKQYYQAAQLDGASKWRVFRKITLPLLSPMVLYITITSLIGAFKAYSSIVAIYGDTMGSGSDSQFMTAVGYIYNSFNQVTGASQWQLLPVSSASAVVLFILIMIVTGFQMLYNKKRVHY